MRRLWPPGHWSSEDRSAALSETLRGDRRSRCAKVARHGHNNDHNDPARSRSPRCPNFGWNWLDLVASPRCHGGRWSVLMPLSPAGVDDARGATGVSSCDRQDQPPAISASPPASRADREAQQPPHQGVGQGALTCRHEPHRSQAPHKAEEKQRRRRPLADRSTAPPLPGTVGGAFRRRGT
jgi:hypothetical protein